MRFFSGFGFVGEAALFASRLPICDSPRSVAGFSLGAIRACQYALETSSRIDRLALFSPAYFQDKDDRFVRLQLISYARDSAAYMRNFYANCGMFDGRYANRDPQEGDLSLSLNYKWRLDMFERLKNLSISVYLGGKDNIINADKALDFFSKTNARIVYIKNANHLLQIEE
ncbi:MAG: pimelyl-ACP methyl ester esterase BioV [Helicobacteraceae bacterium]|nr:pimelyl-ACP methyl ester esterase BioV [Helicobacteraceae bacterium]